MDFRFYILFLFALLSGCMSLTTEEETVSVKLPVPAKPNQHQDLKQDPQQSTLLPKDQIDKQIEELRREIKNAEIFRVGDEIKITFNSQILFATASDKLDPSSEGTLKDLSRVLQKYSGTIIEVSGHTDNVGNEEYNLDLSRRRAATVARFMSSDGVHPTRFRIKGYGEMEPIASNKTEEGRSLNRRVEISIRGNELVNRNIRGVYKEIKDSACLCVEDEYKNFICKRLCDSWMKLPASALSFNTEMFKKPARLDELFASTEQSDGNKLYHVGGGDHVVRQNLKKTLEENNAILMVGKVRDHLTNEPTGATIKVTSIETGELVAEVRADDLTGGYSILLERGRHYKISVEEKGFLVSEDNLWIPENQDFTVIRQDQGLTAIRKGQKMSLNNVFFLQSKAELLPNSYDQLNKVVQLMKVNPSMEIELQGHTDGIGDPDLNFKLSENRVQTIKTYLISQGIAEKRIKVKAFGGTRPIASNDSEETRKLNRRVEFVITKF